MKSRVKTLLLAIGIGMVLPGILFSISEKILPRKTVDTFSESDTEETTITFTTEERRVVPVLQEDGTVLEMDFNTYLMGVLFGEMPVDFDIEALKAQAVVARTYTLKRNTTGQKHENGAVCKNSACCQAYRSVLDVFATDSYEITKLKEAIQKTADEVLYYDGNLIEATYFSCSGGMTEDACAVWGTDIPYLKAVDSPGEENAEHYVDTVQFTIDEFLSTLGISHTKGSSLFGDVTYTAGEGVETMEIGGVFFDGVTLREKLKLKSTSFQVVAVGDMIYITTKGFGHRVGMSQYGAEAMAVKGHNYKEILSHYYPGTELLRYES